jgi:hypothetical protein
MAEDNSQSRMAEHVIYILSQVGKEQDEESEVGIDKNLESGRYRIGNIRP